MSSPKPRILVAESDRFSAAASEMLKASGEVTFADLSRTGLIEALPGVDVLWVRLRNRIDSELLKLAPQLRAVVSPTTGLNHIDVETAKRRKVAVLSLNGEIRFLRTIRATAEHTIALMLALLRHVPSAVEHTRSRQWNRDLFRGNELFGRTVGLVGYGRVGKIVGSYLRTFGAQVLVTDPAVTPSQLGRGVIQTDLPDLLARSSIVSLHVNLSPATTGFFSAQHFEQMKPGAWLINTARGELISEKDLLKALDSGKLAGAALDVLAGEPETIKGHPLLDYSTRKSNLLITPHIGGCTSESLERTEQFMAARLCRWIAQDWAS
jgi:D-3-phosphoglycerate dehydrogenase